MRRTAAAAVLWVAMAHAAAVWGSSATADATAVIAGSGTSYTLTWTAGGDEALRCMGLILLPGEVPTGATGPAGWTIRALPLPGDAQGRWVVHATQPPPGLAPGSTLPIQFTTQAPLAPNTGREIRFSSTCLAGSDVVKQSSGPTASPPPPPPTPPAPPPPPSPRPKKCMCESLDVKATPTVASGKNIILRWTLECTKAGVGACKGTLTVGLAAAAERAGVEFAVGAEDGGEAGKQGTWIFGCQGKCRVGNPKRTFTGSAFIGLIPPVRERLGPNVAPVREQFGPKGIGSVTLEVERFCKRELTTKLFRIAFNAGGIVSERRSDLNGNGVADGDEKKP